MTPATLLIELLTEELPPKSLLAMSQCFAETIFAELVTAGLCDDSAELKLYATPRRLGLKIAQVRSMQADRWLEKKGPAFASAYDSEGKPSKALIGFAASVGREINQLEKVHDGKREVMLARVQQPGKSLAALMPEMLDKALKSLPIAKAMRWADLDDSFVRPVRRITLLHGQEVLPYQRFGINADRITDGHRFLGKQALVIPHADAYEALLAGEGAVVADFFTRRALIVSQLNDAVKQGNPGDTWQASPALVDEVTALTENPTVIEGGFDPVFLQVPQEALMVSMTQHQKYFPVVDGQGRLTSRFLLVANMPEQAARNIRKGNERVLRARLSDAQFFYLTDRKTTLADRVPSLASITYLQALAGANHQGATLLDRIERIQHIASVLAPCFPTVSPAEIQRAIRLAKADLVSDLVGEFPELQGIAGAYYAIHDGEPEPVARAIREHYAPRFSGDTLPETALGQLVAIADKWEALAGLFGINRPPTGDKDPFGLRRASLGIIRMMIELKIPLPLTALLNCLPQVFSGTAWQATHEGGETVALIRGFIQDRLRHYLRDAGYEVSLVESVVALPQWCGEEMVERLEALQAFCQVPSAATLIAMGKRIRNILKQQKEIKPDLRLADIGDLSTECEKVLLQHSQSLATTIEKHLQVRQFNQALEACLPLEAPLATFFDEVMVMDPDRHRRCQRLALLMHLDGLLNAVGVLEEIRL